jgi:IS5 family transposase
MKKITSIVGEVGAKLRDRVKYRVMEIARAARAKGPQSKAKLQKAYGKLLASTSRVVGQAKRFAREIADGTKRARGMRRQSKLAVLRTELEIMLPRVRQVIARPERASSAARRAAKARSSACLSRQRRSFARARPANPTNLGK